MKDKVKYYVEPGAFLVQTSAILMVLAAVLRLIGCWGQWEDKAFLYLQIILPVGCAMLFAAVLLTLGRAALWVSFLPVVLGAVSLIAESSGYEAWLDTLLCILLSLLTAAVYSATAFGRLRTKWIGAALYALLIAYVIFIRDKALLAGLATASAQTVLKELALLCALAALFLTALVMRKQPRPEPLPENLPKIEDPVIIPAEGTQTAAPAMPSEAQSASPELDSQTAAATAKTGDII